jgi:hypothetical protein
MARYTAQPEPPSGLLEPYVATSDTYGSEGASVQQCTGATRLRLISCFLSVCECVLVRRWLQLVLFRICVICVWRVRHMGLRCPKRLVATFGRRVFVTLGATEPCATQHRFVPEYRFRLSGGYKL